MVLNVKYVAVNPLEIVEGVDLVVEAEPVEERPPLVLLDWCKACMQPHSPLSCGGEIPQAGEI
jgi:hypothetical protein